MTIRRFGCSYNLFIVIDGFSPEIELGLPPGGRQGCAKRLEEITEGTGVDYVVDTTGRPELLRLAAGSLGVRGTVALVGAARPGAEVTFEIRSSLLKGWTLKTVVQGSSVPQVFIPQLIQLWRGRQDQQAGHHLLRQSHEGASRLFGWPVVVR
jgi:NADPH:quinone reductase-like Zn-dependent oxidoreductase